MAQQTLDGVGGQVDGQFDLGGRRAAGPKVVHAGSLAIPAVPRVRVGTLRFSTSRRWSGSGRSAYV